MDQDIFRVCPVCLILMRDDSVFQLLIIYGLILITITETFFFDRVEELDLINKPLKIGFQSLENQEPKQGIIRKLLEGGLRIED